ncbi:rod shape-determining protein MreD [Paremcibacter congregatus]|uniref:rod shape-determining protein MreD n=1 Tax=Paremcibacter congregatus TaxID=2043170 RepID=UPI003A8F4EBD
MAVVQENKSERGMRGVIPFVSTLVLILLMQLQYKVAFIDTMFPSLSLMAVYYWCIYKPQLMPVSAVFVLGLLQDIVSGGALGMMALLLILVRVFIVRQGPRLLEREFLFSWLVFIVVGLVYGALSWAIATVYLKESQHLGTAFGHSLLTIAAYPLVVFLLNRLRQLLISESR